MKAYIHTKSVRPNGTCDSFCTVSVPCKIKRLWWQDQGLQYTSSGYGARIPTQYMVQWDGKWRRVYLLIYSNIGTLYIGKIEDQIIVNNLIED